MLQRLHWIFDTWGAAGDDRAVAIKV